MASLSKRLSRTSLWTSLGMACVMVGLTPTTPLAWWAVLANVVAANVAFFRG